MGRGARVSSVVVSSIVLATGCDGVGDPIRDLLIPDSANAVPGRPEAPGPATDAAIVEIVPESRVRVSDMMDVEITIREAKGVAAIAFHLHYDPNVIDFVEPAVEGPFLGQGGSIDTMLLAREVIAGGEVVVGNASIGPSPGASGAGTVVKLRFVAQRAGATPLTFSAARIFNPMVEELPSQFGTAMIRVEP
jgi:hypothetical protein